MMFAAARHRSAATTKLVDVDRTQARRGSERLMSTSCIHPSLAIRIPICEQQTNTKPLCFQVLIVREDAARRGRFQGFGTRVQKTGLPSAELEPHEEAAYDPFRRTNDEQFVVH